MKSGVPQPGTPGRPVRLLFLIDTVAADAGTERQVMEIARRIDRSSFDITFITLEGNQPEELSRQFRLQIFPLRSVWTPAGMLQVLRIAAFLRAGDFDIVQSWMVKAGIVAVLAGNLARMPFILTSRRDLGYYYTPGLLRITKILNRFVTRVTVNSQAVRETAARIEALDPAKIDVLYNGVDLAKFRPGQRIEESDLPALPPGAVVAGIVANYRPVKDLPLFLRAAAIVAKQVPHAVFLLVGKGSLLPELRLLAEELGIADRVVFTDARGSVPYWLQHMSVGCLSSESEGFSNAILEYMAASLPVVAMDAGGNREAIEHGRTGFLVAERTPEAFAEPLIRLLLDPVLRQELGRNGLEACRTRFGLDVATRNVENYYRRLVAGQARAEAPLAENTQF